MGISYRRAPVASKTAFATAAPTGTIAGSPPPCGDSSSFFTRTVSSAGISENRGSSYVSKFCVRMRPPSKRTSSESAYPRPIMMQPSICIFAPSGLITMPMSCAQTTRATDTRPVAASTFTSAIRATYVPASIPHAIPAPRPPGPAAFFQPNRPAAVSRTRRIRLSDVFFRRNSSGSTPAFAAIVSICDSRAKTLMFAPGARHGPVAKRCIFGVSLPHRPYVRMRLCGTS